MSVLQLCALKAAELTQTLPGKTASQSARVLDKQTTNGQTVFASLSLILFFTHSYVCSRTPQREKKEKRQQNNLLEQKERKDNLPESDTVQYGATAKKARKSGKERGMQLQLEKV